jgi:hypothetical protein
MAAYTVAAAASWSCRDASHGLGRKNEREQSKCSLGAAAFVVGCKGILANNACCFNFEREAAAAAALDMAAAVRGQLWRALGLGAAREADGRRRRASEYRRANDARTTHGAGAGRGVEELDAEEKGGGGGGGRRRLPTSLREHVVLLEEAAAARTSA